METGIKNYVHMIRFACTGPESSGKSTLTAALALYYNAPALEEVARRFLQQNNGRYTREDLDEIAKEQLGLWQKHRLEPLVFCDTEMLVVKIWAEVKYGSSSPFIEQAFAAQQFDHYFLCRPDIPWEEDPLREHPFQRQELFDTYQAYLQKYQLPFTIIQGQDLDERIKVCKNVIATYLDK